MRIDDSGTMTMVDASHTSVYDFCFDGKGNIFLANAGTNQVVVVEESHFVTQPLVYGDENGTAGCSETALSDPQGISLDPSGKLYVADLRNHRVVYYGDPGQESANTKTFWRADRSEGTSVCFIAISRQMLIQTMLGLRFIRFTCVLLFHLP